MSKRIVILGAGESGTGAALLAKAKGFDVFVSDAGPIGASYKQELTDAGIPFEEHTHTKELILNANEIVKSPGIPNDAALVVEAISLGIPVIGELEFAYRFASGRFILITGTNGKTTTTLLTYHLLKAAGRDVGLGGNVGHSFARLLLGRKHKIYVLEVSSFQLDGMYSFKADTAMILNITPDHLDRYPNFRAYVNSKFRILQNTTASDRFIYFQDSDVLSKGVLSREIEAEQLRVSLEQEVKNGAYMRDGILHFSAEDGSVAFTVSPADLTIRGPHNMANVMSAVLAAWKEGLSPEEIMAGLKSFQSVPHRLELVEEIEGVKFYNDSKATNIDSTYYALTSFHEPIIWIAGGKDKGNDYSIISAQVKKNVKALVCLGKDNTKLLEFFGDQLPVFDTHSMRDAIREAMKLATEGDVVLLSPACASFDLFKNFEDRGDQFRNEVAAMKAEMSNLNTSRP